MKQFGVLLRPPFDRAEVLDGAGGNLAAALTSRSLWCSAASRCARACWSWSTLKSRCSWRCFCIPAGNNQETDQQQHRDTGNPTLHAADALVTADHRVVQPRIGKTLISHGILLGSGRFAPSRMKDTR